MFRKELEMENKTETRKKVMRVVVGAVVILALMGTMHILVNYFNLLDVIKAIHGG